MTTTDDKSTSTLPQRRARLLDIRTALVGVRVFGVRKRPFGDTAELYAAPTVGLFTEFGDVILSSQFACCANATFELQRSVWEPKPKSPLESGAHEITSIHTTWTRPQQTSDFRIDGVDITIFSVTYRHLTGLFCLDGAEGQPYLALAQAPNHMIALLRCLRHLNEEERLMVLPSIRRVQREHGPNIVDRLELPLLPRDADDIEVWCDWHLENGDVPFPGFSTKEIRR